MADFRNTVIVMMSNPGSQQIQEIASSGIDEDSADACTQMKAACGDGCGASALPAGVHQPPR